MRLSIYAFNFYVAQCVYHRNNDCAIMNRAYHIERVCEQRTRWHDSIFDNNIEKKEMDIYTYIYIIWKRAVVARWMHSRTKGKFCYVSQLNLVIENGEKNPNFEIEIFNSDLKTHTHIHLHGEQNT